MRRETEWSFDDLMASCIWNIPTKNYQNLIIAFQVTVENVGDVFLGHSVQTLAFTTPTPPHRNSGLLTDLSATASRRSGLNVPSVSMYKHFPSPPPASIGNYTTQQQTN